MTVGFDRLPVQESCSTLPTAQLHEADAPQAPVTDGGFLDTRKFLVIENIPAKQLAMHPSMAKDCSRNVPMIPVDEFSGLTHPVIIPPDFSGGTSEHHVEFPKLHPLLRCVSGIALRESFIQRLPDELHNIGLSALHEQFSVPESLPGTHDEQTIATLLAEAGYMPRKGIDVMSGNLAARTLTAAEWAEWQRPENWARTMLCAPEQVLNNYGRWLTAHPDKPTDVKLNAGQQELSNRLLGRVLDIDDAYQKLGRFIETGDPERGVAILYDAARVLVENVRLGGENLATKYRQAREAGQLRADAPEDCVDFVIVRHGSRMALHQALLQLTGLGNKIRVEAA